MTRGEFLRSLPWELAAINTSGTPKFSDANCKNYTNYSSKVLKAYF